MNLYSFVFSKSLPADHDELVELVCRMQKSRFDDQRCDLKTTTTTTIQETGNIHTLRGHRTYSLIKSRQYFFF